MKGKRQRVERMTREMIGKMTGESQSRSRERQKKAEGKIREKE